MRRSRKVVISSHTISRSAVGMLVQESTVLTKTQTSKHHKTHNTVVMFLRLLFTLCAAAFAVALDGCGHVIALKQRNVDAFLRMTDEIADPISPIYTHYMSVDSINAMLAPSPSDKARVLTWARTEFGSSAEIRDLSDALVIRTRSDCGRAIALPPSVAHLIDFVSPLPTQQTNSPRDLARRNAGLGTTPGWTPDPGLVSAEVIRRLYGIDEKHVKAAASQSLGPVEFLAGSRLFLSSSGGRQRAYNGRTSTMLVRHIECQYLLAV